MASGAALALCAETTVPALGALVRGLLHQHPELEVATLRMLVEGGAGAGPAVAVMERGDVAWANYNRPMLRKLGRPIVLSFPSSAQEFLEAAPDLFSVLSPVVTCPSVVPLFGRRNLEALLAGASPAACWRGGDLGQTLHASGVVPLVIEATAPYERLRTACRASRGKIVCVSGVEIDSHIIRLRWALADSPQAGACIVDRPHERVQTPGWPSLTGAAMSVRGALDLLAAAGAERPGVVASVLDFEREAIELYSSMAERPTPRVLLGGPDPASSLARCVADVRGVDWERVATRQAAAPLWRSLAHRPEARRARRRIGARVRRRLATELEPQLDPDELALWADHARLMLRYQGWSPRLVEPTVRRAARAREPAALYLRAAIGAAPQGHVDVTRSWLEPLVQAPTHDDVQAILREAEVSWRAAALALQSVGILTRQPRYLDVAEALVASAGREPIHRALLLADRASATALVSEPEHTRAIWRAAIEAATDPRSPGGSAALLSLLARRASQSRRQSESAEALEAALDLASRAGWPAERRLELVRRRAACLVDAGRPDSALEALEQALGLLEDVEPRAARTVQEHELEASIGHAHLRAGRFRLAADVLAPLAASQEPNAAVLMNLGAAYEQTGQLAEAAVTFRRVLELSSLAPGHPGDAVTLASLGRVQRKLGLDGEALQSLRLGWAAVLAPPADLPGSLAAMELLTRSLLGTAERDAVLQVLRDTFERTLALQGEDTVFRAGVLGRLSELLEAGTP